MTHAEFVKETKWGLGIKNKDDFPEENLVTFGVLQFVGAPLYVRKSSANNFHLLTK